MKTFYALPIFLGLALSQISCSQNSGTSTANNAGNASNSAVSNVQAVAPAKEKSTKPEDYPSLKRQADEMGEAFLSRNHEKFTDYMHPELIRLAGGREKFLGIMNSASKVIDSERIEISKYQVETATQILNHENQLYAVLPTTLVMKMPEMKEPLTDKGALMAASTDEGQNWKFVRIESKSKMKTVFPNVADKLSYPPGVKD